MPPLTAIIKSKQNKMFYALFAIILGGAIEMLVLVAGGVVAFFLLVLIWKSITIAKGDEIITLERRYIGKSMPDGRTVALHGEVGIQARILGPGTHFLPPIYKIKKSKFIKIHEDEVGIVTARTGRAMPSGQYFADPVECLDFQDGEMFLRNNGQKGPQINILQTGEHRINPELFDVEIRKAVFIKNDEVGLVEAVSGNACKVGRIFAEPVECDNFQDGAAFLKNGGQKGPQVNILPPGYHKINTDLFKVEIVPVTVIPGGHIGLVTAMDGAMIPDGRLLAKTIPGHVNFQMGEKFLQGGGEKGRQLDKLMSGEYRINTRLFQVSEPVPCVSIGTDEVGIVTILEGKSIMDPSKIAADEIQLDLHNNFQDAAAFLEAGGQKGLQISVLRSGNYAINPWFADVKKVPMTEVHIGECAVITSYVGEDSDDISDSNVNAKIVPNGKKGIWADPLGPGKHAINTQICKVDRVPTTQILLNWADTETSAHELDSNLNTITLRTADAFDVNMDVSVIIHIAMADAPKVVANLGSVKNMISQVLEPAISSHFRNAAQSVKALDLYTERAELQEKAKTHIQNVLRNYHIESKDTMIADVVLPAELKKTVSDRQLAEQHKKTYSTQKEAENERKDYENAKANANMQPKVIESERNIEIAKNIAASVVKKATGDAEAVEIEAGGKAKATKLNAEADAEAITKIGNAKAVIILTQGKAKARSYQLEVEAMGSNTFGQIKVIEEIAKHNIKVIPDVLITGNGQNGSSLENLLGLNLIEKITGKSIIDFKPETIQRSDKAIEEDIITDDKLKLEDLPGDEISDKTNTGDTV